MPGPVLSQHSSREKIAWLWGIFVAFAAPELLIFLQSLWNFLTRAESSRAKKEGEENTNMAEDKNIRNCSVI